VYVPTKFRSAFKDAVAQGGVRRYPPGERHRADARFGRLPLESVSKHIHEGRLNGCTDICPMALDELSICRHTPL